MASVFYNSFKKGLLDRSADGVDLDTDTIKVALVTSAYTPNIDTHTRFSDITNEVVGTGYTAGGVTLTTPAVAQDNTNDRATADYDDPTWPASTITARGAVVYKSTGTPSTSPLICYIDFGVDKSSSNGTFALQLDATGLLRLA